MYLPTSNDLNHETAKACILGIPFDCGGHPFRIGSREGPSGIRKESRLLRQYGSELDNEGDDAAKILNAVDLGDIDCKPGDIDYTYPRIESAIRQVVSNGKIPVTMGGDGAVTLPQLRAVASEHPDLVVLHIDAHTDAYDIKGYTNATTFTRAAEEELIDPSRSFHVGVRGVASSCGIIRFAESLGYKVIPIEEFTSKRDEYARQIRETIGDLPVYLCFDMDVFDPSCAPGVCNPEWGGLSAQEGLSFIKSLKGLNFVAFDINTVSPPHDIGGMTAFLAASVIWEFLNLSAAAVKGPSA